MTGKEKINIELQNKNEYNIRERSTAYASGIFYNSLKVKQNYIEASKVIVIWLLGFNMFKDGTFHETATMRRDYNNEIVNEDIEYHYIQLPKFLKETDEIKTTEEQWLAYMSGSLNKDELGELFKMNRNIEEINKIVDIVLSDEDIQNELYYRVMDKNLEDLKKKKAYEDGEKVGEKRGEKRGKINGRMEEKIEIAKKLLTKGTKVEDIIDITGLTKEEIEKLKEN